MIFCINGAVVSKCSEVWCGVVMCGEHQDILWCPGITNAMYVMWTSSWCRKVQLWSCRVPVHHAITVWRVADYTDLKIHPPGEWNLPCHLSCHCGHNLHMEPHPLTQCCYSSVILITTAYSECIKLLPHEYNLITKAMVNACLSLGSSANMYTLFKLVLVVTKCLEILIIYHCWGFRPPSTGSAVLCEGCQQLQR